MTNANTVYSAQRCWAGANIITCQNLCGASAASIGICFGDLEGRILMSEETQVRQIEANIAGIERRIEAMREHKSADTTAKISELETIISDLKGHLAWHRRRMKKGG